MFVIFLVKKAFCDVCDVAFQLAFQTVNCLAVDKSSQCCE